MNKCSDEWLLSVADSRTEGLTVCYMNRLFGSSVVHPTFVFILLHYFLFIRLLCLFLSLLSITNSILTTAKGMSVKPQYECVVLFYLFFIYLKHSRNYR